MTIILDPTDERVPVARQISERSGSVQGVVGLLNISKPRGNILLDELDRLHQVARQGHLDLLEAPCAQLLAEAHHAAFAGTGALGNFGHRHMHHVGGVLGDEIGDTAGGGGEVRANGGNAIEHVHQALLLFWHCHAGARFILTSGTRA